MAQRMFDWEYKEDEGLTVRIRPKSMPMVNPLPEESRTHLRSAGREAMLAMRSILDAIVERIDRGVEERREGRKPRKIEVQ